MQSILIFKESIGWLATAAFAASYLVKSPAASRRIRAIAAITWISYGVAMGSLPVIVANTVVAFMAVVYPWLRRAIREASQEMVSVPDRDFAATPTGPARESLAALRA